MPRPKFNDDPGGVWESAARCRRRKKRGGVSLPGFGWFFELDPMSMFAIGLAGLGFLCAAVGILVPKVAYGAIAIGILLAVAGNLLFLAAACSAGAGCVLACLFVPFYSLYFMVTNLDETWRPVVMNVVGIVLLIAGFVIKDIRIFGAPGPGGFDRQSQVQADRTPPPAAKYEPPVAAPFDVDPALKTDDDLVFLSDLRMFGVTNGPWPVTAGHSGAPDSFPVTLNGKVSKHGIGMHPPDSPGTARASFALGGKAKRFKGWAGLGDNRAGDVRTPVLFMIRGDGALIWTSRAMTRKNHPDEFDIDVSRVKVLTLETRTTFHWHAHAIWYEPHLEK